MNNKGFTVIEVAVSFVLVSTISLILLQLVLSLKEVYLTGDVKTSLLNRQGIMTKYIYDDLNDKDLKSVSRCGLSCLTFTYGDNSTKNLLVDPGNKTITYGDYTLQIDSSSYFGTLSVDLGNDTNENNSLDDSLLTINIPIYSKLLDDEDFGIYVVKTYNRSETPINIDAELTSTNVPVTLSGIDTTLTVVKDAETSAITGIFARLFHQTSGNNFSSTDFNNFIKNSNGNTFSTLTSLEAFRIKSNSEDVAKEIDKNLEGNEKALNDQAYQNGYFSFLLNYNNTSLNSANYHWFYQTSNIAKKESLAGYYLKDNASNGITYNDSNSRTSWAYVLGTKANLGVTSGNIIDQDGNNATSVDLYAEAKDYICTYTMGNVTYNNVNIKTIVGCS